MLHVAVGGLHTTRMASTLYKVSLKFSTACDPDSPTVSNRIADHTSTIHPIQLSQREGLCCRSGFMRTRRKYYTDPWHWQSEQTASLLTWLHWQTLHDDVTKDRVLLVRILQLHCGKQYLLPPRGRTNAFHLFHYYAVTTEQRRPRDISVEVENTLLGMWTLYFRNCNWKSAYVNALAEGLHETEQWQCYENLGGGFVWPDCVVKP